MYKPTKWMMAAAIAAATTTPAFVSADVIDDLGGDVVLRLRASDLAQADGTPVTSWTDAVNSVTVTQGSAAEQPTYVASGFNGMPTVSFDGTGDHLSGGSVAGVRTIFAVANLDTSGAANLAGLISNDNDTLNVRRDDTTAEYRAVGNGGDNNDFFRNGGVIGELTVNGTSSPGFSYGPAHIVRSEAGQSANYTDLTLGRAAASGGAAGRFWQGDIAEVVFIDRTLTINETFAVMNHLGDTYGVAVKRGTVLGGLLGGDSTDPDDNGAADANVGYNVVQFIGNNEAAFGGGEFAFNVFDNRKGGGNDKWCCDGPTVPSEGFLFVGAQFATGGQLTHFTVSSSNDSPERDAIHWAIQGSSDGTTWADVFVQDADVALWTGRNQTMLFQAGVDYDLAGNFSWYRYVAYQTGSSLHALGELEFFVVPTPAALPAGLGMLLMIGARRRVRSM